MWGKMKFYKNVDLFAPVWIIGGIILCAMGIVSWWVFALICLSHVKIPISWYGIGFGSKSTG